MLCRMQYVKKQTRRAIPEKSHSPFLTGSSVHTAKQYPVHIVLHSSQTSANKRTISTEMALMQYIATAVAASAIRSNFQTTESRTHDLRVIAASNIAADLPTRIRNVN